MRFQVVLAAEDWAHAVRTVLPQVAPSPGARPLLARLAPGPWAESQRRLAASLGWTAEQLGMRWALERYTALVVVELCKTPFYRRPYSRSSLTLAPIQLCI